MITFFRRTHKEKLPEKVDHTCLLCRQSVRKEYYWVHNHLWEQAAKGLPDPPLVMRGGVIYGGQLLCIGCIEERLGRKLTPADFPTDVPCNRDYVESRRLRDRRRQ